jgi:hypothetical protein
MEVIIDASDFLQEYILYLWSNMEQSEKRL